MKLNRRSAIGAAIGGAIAGPKILQQQESAMPLSPPQGTAFDYGVGEAKGAVDPNFTIRQLAKLKRIASGDLSDEDSNRISNGPYNPIETWRSVSPAAKHFIAARTEERRWRERTIKAALDALNEYDKTGILRRFF